MVYRYFTLPLQLASACRLVHTAVTGPEARRKNTVDEERLQRAWGILDKAWSEIDQIRSSDLSGSAFSPQEIEAYIGSWKIFMFECSKRPDMPPPPPWHLLTLTLQTTLSGKLSSSDWISLVSSPTVLSKLQATTTGGSSSGCTRSLSPSVTSWFAQSARSSNNTSVLRSSSMMHSRSATAFSLPGYSWRMTASAPWKTSISASVLCER